jgi:hypothetical protein
MFTFLRNFHLDPASFWIGFVCALVAWWLITRVRQYWPEIIAPIKRQIEISAKKASAGIRERVNQETLRRVQGMHLASPLFSLDEILVPPRLLAPLSQVDPADPYPNEDVVHPILPYLPDWPELSGQFHTPTLSLLQALQGDAHIAIVGRPGAGKTVALASLATQIIRGDPNLGSLKEYTAIFLHVSDVDISNENMVDFFEVILAAERGYISPIIASQASTFLQRTARNGELLLLLDGADEVSPDQLKKLTKFLAALLAQYPHLRLVLSASQEYLDGLVSLGVVPLSLTHWNETVRARFLQRWGALWAQFVEPIRTPSANQPAIAPILIENWLSGQTGFITPLELTLKIWAAYACDSFGTKSTDAMDSFIRRLISDPKILPAFEKVALEMLKTEQSALPISQVETVLAESSINSGNLTGSGLLTKHSNKLVFVHPVLMGYLAGQAIKDPQQLNDLIKQPAWTGRSLGLHYAATCNDLSAIVNTLLDSDKDDPFIHNLFMVSRWLQDIPSNTNWRGQVMRELVNVMKRESYPFSLRARGLAALLATNDTSIVALFRQMLGSVYPVVRLLGVVGCGAMRDTRSSVDLISMLRDPDQSVRQAAGLTLIALDTLEALDSIKAAIVTGDEILGRIVAISLAAHLPDGQTVLQGWSQDGNLLVRRACVYGLESIRDRWAEEALEKLSIEDGEWIVRNAAGQAIENRRKPDPQIPRILPDAHNVPWLIAFASKQGVGISPAQPATPVLVSALEKGGQEEQQAALEYLPAIPDLDPGAIMSVFKLAYNSEGFIREIAFFALWRMAAAGIPLPSPVEYGLLPPIA